MTGGNRPERPRLPTATTGGRAVVARHQPARPTVVRGCRWAVDNGCRPAHRTRSCRSARRPGADTFGEDPGVTDPVANQDPAVGNPAEPVPVDPQTAADGRELGEQDLVGAGEAVTADAVNDRIAAELSEMLAEAELRSMNAHAAPLRLMAVHAHPDDESSKGAATLASYAAAGVGVMVVSCTGGERGDILNPKFDIGDLDIPQLRQAEMARAAQILGIAHAWLGFEDSGYHEGDPSTWDLPTGSLRRSRPADRDRGAGAAGPPVPAARDDHVRRERRVPAPRPHPLPCRLGRRVRGRRRPGRLSRTRVSRGNRRSCTTTSASPGTRSRRSTRRSASGPASGPTTSGSSGSSRSTALTPASGRPPGCRWPSTSTTGTGPCWPTRRRSTPSRTGSSVPRDVEAEVWGTEDYELARSLVDTTLPEDDLFAGVRDRVARDRSAGRAGRCSC